MSDIAICVENLSKQYRIGGPSTAPSAMLRTRLRTGKRERYKTLRDTLTDTFTAPFRRLSSLVLRPSSRRDGGRKTKDEYIWALKDVSLEVQRGKVVGIPSTSLRASPSTGSGQALGATGRARPCC